MSRESKENGCSGQCSKTCGPVEVPTAEEKEALEALRRIKSQVREIKKNLEDMESGSKPGGSEEADRSRVELDRLRGEWEEWQNRLDEATHRRMVLLGHEEPE